ncbi:ROK family protein [Flavihumibacter petaseus]|uniref:Putative glucokinase n=1 Tax=Flavihumibacter petaseus NBRC 106054 TaxID=1220578 RepID=A0A0E9N2J8_9BACT|nr:ROK family protein [Flavihumibacter petaseus]GAO44069.1 putative glucokinase [Flavihumibacter petaseus NBRC 106054]
MIFWDDLESESKPGIALKNNSIKKEIISILSLSGNVTIPDLSKKLVISVPKITALVNELIADSIVSDYGKSTVASGRKPSVYGLVADSGFFLGVDIKHSHINIGLIDLCKNLASTSKHIPYTLTNERHSLDELCNIIKTFIANSAIPGDKIVAMGLNLSGRINSTTGYSYSFFHFNEDPLSVYLEQATGIKTFIENDSRAMAYGEYIAGAAKNEKNVLFLNLDYGIGMGIIINGQLYYGKSGFAGEFGHIPFFDNEIICQCGKKGCLETEASGRALTHLFREKIKSGYASIITKDMAPEDIKLSHIIQAVKDDDVLAIDLIAEIGEKLGKGIATLINLYNPELIVLGGALAETSEYILLPIKSAINKYSLNLVNTDTQIKLSQLNENAGVVGACFLARDRVLEAR